MGIQGGSGGKERRRLRLCALAVGVLVAWAAESYESDLNVARPAVLAVAPPTRSTTPGPARRLVWVLVDGLRLDASRTMPVLNQMRAEGLDVAARTEFPSYSGPNFVAQASGLEPAASGVLANGYPGESQLDSVFRRAKLAGLRTALVTTDPGGDMRDVYASWIDEIRTGDPLERVPAADLVLVHIGDTDWAAHDYGTRSPQYRAAVARVDAFLGRVLATLDPGRDAVLVSSDHGNLVEGGHGGTEPDVMKIPLVAWGAGVVPGSRREVGRGRDVGPTIASLLGVGPLQHATGRPVVGDDDAAVLQRAAVFEIVGPAGKQRTSHVPLTILVAVGAFAWLRRGSRPAARTGLATATYALVYAGLLVATHTVSFSVSNLTAPFAMRLTTLCALAGLAQYLIGGPESVTEAAFATSLAVLAVIVTAALQPLAPADGTLRFLPIPALTGLAFICLMTAAIGGVERLRAAATEPAGSVVGAPAQGLASVDDELVEPALPETGEA